MIELYYSPAACSISAHIILIESDVEFHGRRVLTKQGGTRTPEFLRMNPKGKVPVLVLDGYHVLTETPVILQFLATTFPDKPFVPDGRRQFYAALEICEYLANTVHNLAISRLFRPDTFSPHEEDWEAIRIEGRSILLGAFDMLTSYIRSPPYIFDRFSIADASLFFFELHASRLAIPMPTTIRAHFEHMLTEPSVQAGLAREDLKLKDFRPSD